MSEKYFVGLDVVSSSNNGKYKPVSRVTLMLDDSKAITAGDDTGYEIIADCPHATQAMVDSLLASFKGHEYQAYSAGDANIDPSAELGDGITVSGIYSVLSRMRDDGSGFPSVEAPGKAEDEDEYPSGGPMTQAFERQLAQARSLISKTAEEIRLEVSKKVGESEVKSLISTEVGKIRLSVSSANGSTTFTLTDQDATLSTQTLNLSVDAVNINGKLNADQLNISGAITFNDLSTAVQDRIDSAGERANDAYDLAENADSLVGMWQYGGTTYIDGAMLKTGTVMASQLLGGSVGLLASDESVVGSIDITFTNTGYGLEISTARGGVLINSAGNWWVTAQHGEMGITTSGIVCGVAPVPQNDGVTLGTYGFPWADIYTAFGKFSELVARVEALEAKG